MRAWKAAVAHAGRLHMLFNLRNVSKGGKQVCSRCRMKQGSTHWWHCWKEQCRRCFPIEDKGGRLKSGHAQDLMLVSLLSFSGLSACSQSNWTSVCINHQDDAILPRKVMVRTCFGSKDAQQQHQELQPTECTRTKVPRVLPARTVFCLAAYSSTARPMHNCAKIHPIALGV
eukprot:1144830-Pelagomonas_calceolata.AAC.2